MKVDAFSDALVGSPCPSGGCADDSHMGIMRCRTLPQQVSLAPPEPSEPLVTAHHSTQRACLLSTTSGCVWLSRRHVSLYAAQTPFLHAVLARCPSLRTVYTSPWWLCNGHTETIFAWATRKVPNVVYYRRCLSLADGGVLALDYDDSPESQVPPLDAQLSTIILARQSSTYAGAKTTTCAGAARRRASAADHPRPHGRLS